MQKSAYIRHMEHKLRELFMSIHNIKHGSDIVWEMRVQEFHKITANNRDRPGGNVPSTYNIWKRRDRKKLRKQQKQITRQSLLEYHEDVKSQWYEYLDQEAHNWHEEWIADQEYMFWKEQEERDLVDYLNGYEPESCYPDYDYYYDY